MLANYKEHMPDVSDRISPSFQIVRKVMRTILVWE